MLTFEIAVILGWVIDLFYGIDSTNNCDVFDNYFVGVDYLHDFDTLLKEETNYDEPTISKDDLGKSVNQSYYGKETLDNKNINMHDFNLDKNQEENLNASNCKSELGDNPISLDSDQKSQDNLDDWLNQSCYKKNF